MNVNPLYEIKRIKPIFRAGAERFILPRYGRLTDADIVREGRLDQLVTVSDTDTSAFILEPCQRRFPGSFTEEELSPKRFEHDDMWEIDPLDGTDEFKNEQGGFCIQGALLQRSGSVYKPVGGIIYMPLEDTFVYATETEGPFVDVNGVGAGLPSFNREIIVATQRRVDISLELDTFYEFLCPDRGVKVITTGGAGHTIAKMISGRKEERPNLYIMPRPYTKEWDLSPAECIIARAGGFIVDLEGKPFTYNRENVKNELGYVVGIGIDQGWIIGKIREFGIHNLLKPRE